MKRMICIIAIFVMLASLTACDGVSIQINIGGKETTAPNGTGYQRSLHSSGGDRGVHRRSGCHGAGRA